MRTPGPLGGRNTVTVPVPEGSRDRVLAVDPELDRVPRTGGIVVAERLAVGDPDHLANQVDAGDLLGDRVLDLQARVHLEEGDRAVLADQELAGAGSDVARLAAGSPWTR